MGESVGPKRAWVWAYANKDGDCFFDCSESRGRDSPQRSLGNFVGYLYDDGYCVYERVFDLGKVAHVACWAHVRRKFVEVIKKEPAFAREAVDQIARQYAIDSEAQKGGPLTLSPKADPAQVRVSGRRPDK